MKHFGFVQIKSSITTVVWAYIATNILIAIIRMVCFDERVRDMIGLSYYIVWIIWDYIDCMFLLATMACSVCICIHSTLSIPEEKGGKGTCVHGYI